MKGKKIEKTRAGDIKGERTVSEPGAGQREEILGSLVTKEIFVDTGDHDGHRGIKPLATCDQQLGPSERI